MSVLWKIVVFVSCLYLLHMAVVMPLIARYSNGKHQTLKVVVVSSLAAVCLLAVGAYLRLILP